MSWAIGAIPMPEKPPTVVFARRNSPIAGTTGSNISGVNDDLGNAVTKHAGWAGEFVKTAGGLWRPSVNFAWLVNAGTPPGADYDVEADFYFADLSGTSRILGIGGRIDAGTPQTGYFADAVVSSSAVTWRIRKIIAGSGTAIGSQIPGSVSAGQTKRVRLRMTGTALELWVDGTKITSATDSDITAAGKSGYLSQAITPTSDTQGVHLGNFLAQRP